MPVILRRVLLSMVTWRQNSHLMPVDSIVVEEVTCLLVDFPRTELITPQMQQLLVHRPWAELADLAEVPEDRELGVRDAHVGFVGLHVR